jgi:hypothetical protein
MREQLIQFLTNQFVPEQLYTRVEIVSAFENAKADGIKIPNAENPTAFTYNRWNLGMTEIIPLFEYLYYKEGDQKYKYLGYQYDYNGGVYHCPDNDIPQIQIALFQNGKFKFLGTEIKNLEDWKNSRNLWVQIVRLGSFITTCANDKSSTIRKYLIIEGEVNPMNNATNGYGHISFNSKLAQKMLFKQIGDTFKHGDFDYTIKEIENS